MGFADISNDTSLIQNVFLLNGKCWRYHCLCRLIMLHSHKATCYLLQLLTRGLLGAFKGWGQKWAFFVSPTALVLETWNLAKSFLAVGMFENCWPWHQAPQVLLMLTYLFISAKLNGTGQRWVNELSYFNFSIHYKRGSENVVKDSLSRYPLLHECDLQ